MTTAREAAEVLRTRGFALCKPDPAGKKPTYRGWPLRSLEPADFGADDMLGIMGGPLSNAGQPGHALVVIDLDDLEAVARADSYLPATGMSEGRAGKLRSHRYYLVPTASIPDWGTSAAKQAAAAAKEKAGHPGPFIKQFRHRETNAEVLRFIGTGGQCVAPPSNWRSKDGTRTERREWAGGTPGEPAIVSFAELWDSVCRLASACRASIPEVNARPSLPRVSASVIDRAAKYLDRVPPAISGQGGHNQLFAAVRALVWGFALPDATALRLLVANYNPRCQPTWSEKELTHKIEDAGRVPFGKPFGYLRDAERNGTASVNANGKEHHETGDNAPPAEPPNDAPDNPHRLAAGFLESVSPGGTPYQLRFWRGDFHRYDSGAYRPVPEGDLRGELTRWTRAEFVRLNQLEMTVWRERNGNGGSNPPKVRPVTVKLANDVLQALRGVCLLPSAVDAPAWIDGATGPDPAGLLPMRNGLLDLATAVTGRSDCLLPPSPAFFTSTAAPFNYDPHAPPPRQWLEFLHSLWPDDPQSIEALQEWFGYLLTPNTRQQKILFLLGPRRSGKGTIARVLREVVGQLNVAGPTLGSLATNFGLSPLLGRSVAIISDARLSGRTDAAAITERLLSISGEDALTVDRKHRDAITAKLPTRFVILSNELPRLGDPSGALAGRLILLRLARSWFGKEDPHLFDRLRLELPGIFLWAVKGCQRLQERGRFVQPASGAELVEDMEDLSSPVGAFVRERCWVEPGCRIEVGELYREWRSWCDAHGRKEPGTEETFGRDLRAVVPELGRTRPRTSEGRVCFYTGIRLRRDSDPDDRPTVNVRSMYGQRDGQRESAGIPSVVNVVNVNPTLPRESEGEVVEGAGRDAMAGHGDHVDQPDSFPSKTVLSCPRCGRALDGRTCWHCRDRLCAKCGTWTSSELRSLRDDCPDDAISPSRAGNGCQL